METLKVKILLQRVWELKVSWNDIVSPHVSDVWCQWRKELGLLEQRHTPQYYFLKKAEVVSVQLHGFSNASEEA